MRKGENYVGESVVLIDWKRGELCRGKCGTNRWEKGRTM